MAIIYKGCLSGDSVKRIHKALYDATINTKKPYTDKYLLALMLKTTNRAKKIRADSVGDLAVAILDMFLSTHLNDKSKKIINHDTQKQAEQEKDVKIHEFIDKNREDGRWFYLASSHNDCAEDHKPYQGRLYVDEKAPDDVIEYAKSRGLYSVQWVMEAPAWFITRPNCRHFFVSLKESEVRKKSLKRLKRKYKTHTKEGDRDFQTPRKVAIEEYEDRLRMLRALYAEHPTQKLKNEILKTEMLLRKWKNKA